MTFTKTAAVAALALAAAFGTTMTAANAGKKHNQFHNNHMFHKKHNNAVIVFGSPDYGCKRWLRLYKKTGNPVFLDRYYVCKY